MSQFVDSDKRWVPYRALLVGALLAVVINTVFPYGLLVMGTLDWTGDFIALSAIFLLFLLLLVNIPLKWIGRKWSLSAQELVVIYAMMVAASAIPSTGVTAQLVPFLAGVYYYATPENNWAELLHPHIQPWLAPQDPMAVKYFYEGLPQEIAIPWGAWLVPLLAWASFLGALYLMMIALSALLHEQWARNERLIFPLVQLPLYMIHEDDRPSAVNPFLKEPLMWLGFAIPFVLLGINALHKYYPFIAPIQLSTQLAIFHDMRGVLFNLWFIVLGLTYFLSLEVSFSLWFFYLLNFFQLGLFNTLGFSIAEIRLMHTEGSIATAQQAIGSVDCPRGGQLVDRSSAPQRSGRRSVEKEGTRRRYRADTLLSQGGVAPDRGLPLRGLMVEKRGIARGGSAAIAHYRFCGIRRFDADRRRRGDGVWPDADDANSLCDQRAGHGTHWAARLDGARVCQWLGRGYPHDRYGRGFQQHPASRGSRDAPTAALLGFVHSNRRELGRLGLDGTVHRLHLRRGQPYTTGSTALWAAGRLTIWRQISSIRWPRGTSGVREARSPAWGPG